MIRRLSVVIWWCGAVTLAFAVSLMVLGFNERYNCSSKNENLEKLDSNFRAWKEQYQVQHPGSDVDLYRRNSKDLDIPFSLEDLTEEDRATCKVPDVIGIILVPTVLVFSSLCFWALTFILSGSFFRPSISKA